MPEMTSHYPGRCKSCGSRFAAGERIYWTKSSGAICMDCRSGNGRKDDAKEKAETETGQPKPETRGMAEPLPTAQVAAKESYFTMDWADLKNFVSQTVRDGKADYVTRNSNRSKVIRHCTETGDWHGYTRNDLKQWLREGYKSSAIQNLGDFSPSLREKRKWIFSEDGDEIYVDRALSGEDNYAGEWSVQERIPGAAIEAEVMFAASVRAEVVNAYNAWICTAVYALESAGIDCQVTLKFSSHEAVKSGETAHTTVRVKKENETADFMEFSPMLSPAALRTFGFTAIILHADSRGIDVDPGLGRGRRTAHNWDCSWDNERRVLKIDCPYIPQSFPREEMEAKFRKALKDMKA